MKITQLLEARFEPNVFFVVDKPIKAWRHTGFVPTNNYYGASQIYAAKYVPFELQPGDEVHWLHGGLHAAIVSKRIGFFIKLSAPTDASPFERSGVDITPRQLAKLVDAGELKQIAANKATRVEYEVPA